MITAIQLAGLIGSSASAEENTDQVRTFLLSAETEAFLEDHCYDCHDADTQKGEIRLDQLTDLENPKRLDLLNRIQEQIYFRHMPPKKKMQPGEEERKSILSVISTELGLYEASTLEGKLMKPEFGNYMDHEKLFSGKYKELPGFTDDRRALRHIKLAFTFGGTIAQWRGDHRPTRARPARR